MVYDADALQSDFRMKQGSTLDDRRWRNVVADSRRTIGRKTAGRNWICLSLVIDGGTFSRMGSVTGEGGGALIFGSWRGDDNFGEADSELDHYETIIEITNGGRLENEGQLWFGGWGDTPPNGTVIIMNINDGTLDLTGGDVPGVGDAGDADLVFTNRFIDEFDLPTYAINFTGPGSITVDSSGIINAYRDENEEWQNLDPVTYEVLWDEGILQANGKSGVGRRIVFQVLHRHRLTGPGQLHADLRQQHRAGRLRRRRPADGRRHRRSDAAVGEHDESGRIRPERGRARRR